MGCLSLGISFYCDVFLLRCLSLEISFFEISFYWDVFLLEHLSIVMSFSWISSLEISFFEISFCWDTFLFGCLSLEKGGREGEGGRGRKGKEGEGETRGQIITRTPYLGYGEKNKTNKSLKL